MKKIISLLLVVCLLVTALPSYAFAENTAVFSVGTASAKAGETVDIPVVISNNSGIVALKVTVSYDADVLALTGVTSGNLFSGGDVLFGNDLTANPYNLIWLDSLSKVNYTNNGTFAVLHFTVNANASAGDTTIGIACDSGSTFNVDLVGVPFAAQNGTVTVLPAEKGGWHFDEDSTLRTIENEDFGTRYVVGLNELDPCVYDYVITTGGWSAEVIPNEWGFESTGAQLVLYDETHTEAERYDIVLYGDVNGDASLDPGDISVIVSATDHIGVVSWEDASSAAEFAGSMAADVYHDDEIGPMDISVFLDMYDGNTVFNQCWTCSDDPWFLPCDTNS